MGLSAHHAQESCFGSNRMAAPNRQTRSAPGEQAGRRRSSCRRQSPRCGCRRRTAFVPVWSIHVGFVRVHASCTPIHLPDRLQIWVAAVKRCALDKRISISPCVQEMKGDRLVLRVHAHLEITPCAPPERLKGLHCSTSGRHKGVVHHSWIYIFACDLVAITFSP